MGTRKTPKDHMKPRLKLTGTDQDFTFTTKDGTTFTLPPAGGLPIGFARSIRKLPEADQIFTILEAIAEPSTLEIIDNMDGFEFGKFYKEWDAHNKRVGAVTPGE